MADVISALLAQKKQKSNGVKRAAQSVALSMALAASAVAVAVPQVAVAQSYSFSKVAIEGNKRVEAATILSYAQIAKGSAVSAAQLNDAYQRLSESGLFKSVDLVPQGSRLIIKVEEHPTVNRIAFEGNRRIKDDDLAAIVQTQSRRVFSARLAEEDAQRISEAYVQQGRIAARVVPKIIKRSDNRLDVVFEVFEGGVTEIERIVFTGNQQYSDNRLRRALQTKQAGLLRAVIQKDTFIADRVEFDKQLLRDFYLSRGYVDFRIRSANAELSQERDGFFLNFVVEEGQQFRVGEVTVTSDLGEVDPDLFQSKLKLRTGKVYSPSIVENEIARLERLALREGLTFVRVEPRVSRNDRDLTLDVEFVLTKGPRIFVERIDIEGNTTTMDQVIRRQFDLVEGDPFNPRAIRQSAERIRALGFFKNADVQAREGSSPQQVIVDVEVEEQPTGSISFGGSYSTTSGFGAAISFSERNFLGRGQSIGVNINTSTSSTRYGFNFAEPAFLGRNVTFGFGINYSESNNVSSRYNINSGQFRPYLTFPISDNGSLQLRYTLDYGDLKRNKSRTIGGITSAELDRGAIYDSSVGYTFSYDTRRNGLDPTTAVRLEFGQDFAGLGGDRQFVNTSAKAIAQKKVWNEEVTLRATLEAGALHFNKGSSRVTDRFFLGPNTMRGFEFGGIGPRERGAGFNDSLGGEYYAVAKFDAEFPLGLPEEYGIRGAVFYDIGSVWNAGDLSAATGSVSSNGFDARHVVGVSVLWDSILGPLRVNFSEPLRKQKQDKPLAVNLSVSTKF